MNLSKGEVYMKVWQISSAIRQKGESPKDVTRKQSTSNLPNNEHFLPADTHTYVFWG